MNAGFAGIGDLTRGQLKGAGGKFQILGVADGGIPADTNFSTLLMAEGSSPQSLTTILPGVTNLLPSPGLPTSGVMRAASDTEGADTAVHPFGTNSDTASLAIPVLPTRKDLLADGVASSESPSDMPGVNMLAGQEYLLGLQQIPTQAVPALAPERSQPAARGPWASRESLVGGEQAISLPNGPEKEAVVPGKEDMRVPDSPGAMPVLSERSVLPESMAASPAEPELDLNTPPLGVVSTGVTEPEGAKLGTRSTVPMAAQGFSGQEESAFIAPIFAPAIVQALAPANAPIPGSLPVSSEPIRAELQPALVKGVEFARARHRISAGEPIAVADQPSWRTAPALLESLVPQRDFSPVVPGTVVLANPLNSLSDSLSRPAENKAGKVDHLEVLRAVGPVGPDSLQPAQLPEARTLSYRNSVEKFEPGTALQDVSASGSPLVSPSSRQYEQIPPSSSPEVSTPEATIAETVTYWAAQGVQNAELKLDAWGGEALAVSITMNGNEAEVEFRTDQPEVRQVIEGAMPQLKEALAEEGLVLSGVAVGTSGRQGADTSERRTPQNARQLKLDRLDEGGAMVRRPTVSGVGRALDLFV